MKTKNRKYDLLNQRFGKLTAIEYDHYDSKVQKSYWLCLCDCGNKKVIFRSSLISGDTQSCGCIQNEVRRKKVRHTKGFGVASFNVLYKRYIKNAELRNINFDLSKDLFQKLTKGNCFYCGTVPSTSIGKIGKPFNGDYIHNGIDRMNPNLGYTESNCVTCCSLCNFMKYTLSYDEFIERIDKILQIHLDRLKNKNEV